MDSKVSFHGSFVLRGTAQQLDRAFNRITEINRKMRIPTERYDPFGPMTIRTKGANPSLEVQLRAIIITGRRAVGTFRAMQEEMVRQGEAIYVTTRRLSARAAAKLTKSRDRWDRFSARHVVPHSDPKCAKSAARVLDAIKKGTFDTVNGTYVK